MAPPLRSAVPASAAPASAGPLASSGAAPDLPAESPPIPAPSTASEPTAAPAPDAPAAAAAPDAPDPTSAPNAVRRFPRAKRTAAATAGSVRAWSARPAGRLTLPALRLLILVAVTGTAGAVLVPATARAPRPAVADATQGAMSVAPDTALPAPTGSGLPSGATTPVTAGPTGTPTPPASVVGRPADVLAGWAQQTGGRVGVPAVAMQAYGYAELVLAQTTPACRLTWTTLAAIGSVESNHGRANGATLGPDGKALPPIIGLPLDGQGGRQRINDTDAGRIDGDQTYDRAVGPMQFIPATWRDNGVDADNDGAVDAHDIDDAALAAGNYLCKNGRDLSTAQDWWNAILSYNAVRPYAQAVFDAANRYGVSSRT